MLVNMRLWPAWKTHRQRVHFVVAAVIVSVEILCVYFTFVVLVCVISVQPGDYNNNITFTFVLI